VRILLFVLLGALIFSSCGKKRSIHITAKNAATGERYAGLQYFIVSSTTSGDGEKYKTEKSGFLNENGEASEIIREKQYRTYAVRVVEPESSCYNKVITMYFGSPNDEDGHFNFEFAECAYLKQNITNVNCQGSGDYMILYTKNQANSLGLTGWEFFGCNGYIGDHFSNVPMGKYYFEWHVTRNSITNIYYDTIYLSPGEYKTYDINY